MNYIWCGMILISLIAGAANGLLDETISAAFESASISVSTVLSFAGVMCFWTGMLKIAEVSGACEKLQRLLSPIVGRLFPGTGENAKKYITMNLSANILGMGGIATPAGISATTKMCGRKNFDGAATLFVLASTSIQLLPTTVISLRQAFSSANPSLVFLPSLLSSAVCTAIGLGLCFLFKKRNRRKV